ncbi:MAG: Fic family protein [bacterium]|nr:Fic family protein [bacterium]
MSERELILKLFDSKGIDMSVVIREMFLGYKQRKQRRQLYSEDNTVPTTLLKMYFSLNPEEIEFESLKNAFVSRYIKNESKLEAVHSPEEIEGLREMYEYIHSDEIEDMFDIFTLKTLHEKLYSKTPYPEFGGSFRREPARIKNCPSDLVPWYAIFSELKGLNDEVLFLKEVASFVREWRDPGILLDYLDQCVVLGCNLIKIHPFADGNGRTVRGFVNKLLEDAGFPPVYIKAEERDEYHDAMGKAIGGGDYSEIKNFYRYKVCDSIIELDINERLKQEVHVPPMVDGVRVAKQKSDDLNKKPGLRK